MPRKNPPTATPVRPAPAPGALQDPTQRPAPVYTPVTGMTAPPVDAPGSTGAYNADGSPISWTNYLAMGNMLDQDHAAALVKSGQITQATADAAVQRWADYQAKNPGGPSAPGAPGAPGTPGGGSGGGTPGVAGFTQGWSPTGGTSDQRNALDSVRGMLAQVGLDSLAPWVWNEIINGSSAAQVGMDLRARPEYQARFPGMGQLTKAGMAMTEAQYISREQALTSLASAQGLPQGFLNRNELGQIIGSQQSDSEFQHRLQLEQSTASQQVDPATRAYLKSHYNMSDGDIFAMWLDPAKTVNILQQQATASQIGGAFTRSGLEATAGGADLSTAQAEHYAQLGITAQQAQAGFGQAYQNRELAGALPGVDGGNGVGMDSLLKATVEGSAPDAQAAAREQERRKASFGNQGGYVSTQAGVTGLGSANT